MKFIETRRPSEIAKEDYGINLVTAAEILGLKSDNTLIRVFQRDIDSFRKRLKTASLIKKGRESARTYKTRDIDEGELFQVVDLLAKNRYLCCMDGEVLAEKITLVDAIGMLSEIKGATVREIFIGYRTNDVFAMEKFTRLVASCEKGVYDE